MAAMSPRLLHALVCESRTMLQTQLRPGFVLQAVSEGVREKVSGCKPAVIKPVPALLSTSATPARTPQPTLMYLTWGSHPLLL